MTDKLLGFEPLSEREKMQREEHKEKTLHPTKDRERNKGSINTSDLIAQSKLALTYTF